MAKKIVVLYVCFAALSQFGINFISAYYVMFLLKNGLNLFEVNVVNMAFMATVLIMELPTGTFADRFGRKRSFIISCLIFSVSMLVYCMSNSIAWFIVAEIIGAVGLTFASGAFAAWFVDEYSYHGGAHDNLPHIYARERQASVIAGMVAALTGAYAAEYDASLPWFLGSLFFGVTALFAAVYMPELAFKKLAANAKQNGVTSWKLICQSVDYAKGSAGVKFTIVAGTLLSFTMMALNMQWQPFFAPHTGETSQYGFIWVGISLASLLGGRYAPFMEKRLRGKQKTLIAFLLAIALAILAAVAGAGILSLALAGFFLHEFFRGAYLPIKTAYFQQSVRSEIRATIGSLESVAFQIGALGGLLLSGLLAHWGSISISWTVSALILFFGALIIGAKFRK